MSEKENQVPEPQEQPKLQPEQPPAPENGVGKAQRGGWRGKGKAPLLLGAGAACIALLAGLAMLFVSKPAKPAAVPEGPDEQPPVWEYPSPDAYNSIQVDDFFLIRDGSIEITSEISSQNSGLSTAYLEEKLKLNPAAPFTVEQASAKRFLIHIEGGQTLPETMLTLEPGPEDEQTPYYQTEWTISPHYDARVRGGRGSEESGHPIEKPVVIEFSDRITGDPAEAALLDELDNPIPCGIEVRDNQLTLTPEGGYWDYASQYTLSLPDGFAVGGGVLTHASRVWFWTEQPNYSLVLTTQGVHTYRPDDEIVLEYQLDTTKKVGMQVQVQTYAFPDAQAYSTWLLGGQDSPDGAQPVGTAGQVKMGEGLNEYPIENPGQGFFLVCSTVTDDKTGEKVSQYAPFQIASPSVYLQSGGSELLAWLHDYRTGAALSGYKLTFSRGGLPLLEGVTDASGLLTLDHTPLRAQLEESAGRYAGTDSRMNEMLFTVRDPQGALVYVDTTRGLLDSIGYGGPESARYYSFFYNDRMLYRPTDTIRFWGFLKPYRYNTTPMPGAVTVTLDPGGLEQKVQVQVGADGTYTGELQLDKLAANQYELEVSIPDAPAGDDPADGRVQPAGKRVLKRLWVDIKEFTTPAYTISASVDRLIYRMGDEVQVRITPTFYDGTPLPNYPIEFNLFNPYTGNFDAMQQVMTDSRGTAQVTFKAGETFAGKNLPWTPQRAYYYVQIAHDGENITYRGDYVFLPGNEMIRPSVAFREDGTALLTVQANRITTERITEQAQVDALVGSAYSYSYLMQQEKYDLLAGEPVSIDLKADLWMDYRETIDFTYTSKEQQLSLPVRNGTGQAVLFDFDYGRQYYAYFSADLSYSHAGNTILTGISGSNHRPDWEVRDEQARREAFAGYTFNVYREGGKEPIQSYETYLMRSTAEADVGEQIRLELLLDGVPVPAGQGQLLYTVLQDRTIDRQIVRSAGLTFRPQQEHANSVLIAAAYYDGREVHPVSNLYLRINRESMELQVQVTPGQEAYRPGEEAVISAKVTDRDGVPVSASLCFGVVDEAIFALREQDVQTLDDLYSNLDFYNYYVFKYTTLRGDISPFNQSGDGGKGDGDGMAAYDSFRKNFKDTAAFYSVHSDEQGCASFRFTLPDNVTSWRITTVAVGDNLYGGSDKTNFVTSLPFFCKPVISPKYIAGDEIALLLQGHGTALSEGDEIAYTVQLTGDGTDLVKTAKGRAYEPMQLNFGVLPEGEYTLTASAQFGQMRDTVELPLAVIPSSLELVVSREFDPAAPLSFDMMRYPVTLSLYDPEYEAYYKNISSLLTHYCFRIDQRMSRFAAKRAMLRHTAYNDLPQHIRVGDGDVAGYQNPDGGIGWYVGGESDPVVSMKVAMFAGDMFSAPRLREYFRSVTEDSGASLEQKAAAWGGLCVVDPSYAPQVRERIADSRASFEEQLYLLAGLAHADEQSARKLYGALVAPKLRHNGKETWLSYAAPNDEQQEQRDDRASGLAWITASRLGLEDADGFGLYFGKEAWRVNTLFESMIYVHNYQKTPPKNCRVRALIEGKERVLDLSGTGSVLLTLNRSEFESLQFTSVPEGLRGMAYFIGEPSEAGLQPSDNLSVEKRFEPMGEGKYKAVIEIAFDSEAAFGYYNVSDWVPSNMRLHTVAKQPQKDFWVQHTQENQKLYFEFYRDRATPSTVKIEYYIQQTYQSAAMADRTYVVCADSGENGFSERCPFTPAR